MMTRSGIPAALRLRRAVLLKSYGMIPSSFARFVASRQSARSLLV